MGCVSAEWQREAEERQDIYPTQLPAVLVMESGRSERKVARDTLCVTLTYQPRILELFSRLHALLTGIYHG